MPREKKMKNNVQDVQKNMIPKTGAGKNDSRVPTDAELRNMLHDYVNAHQLSWTQLSRQLGVTQNTLTNWNKGGRISERNRRNILALINDPSLPPVIIDYKSRLDDPISAAMRRVWGALSERDKARVYMLALECRDGIDERFHPGMYVPAVQEPESKAAEPRTPYNQDK